MTILDITCFGDFETCVDSRPVHGFGTDKTRALLAYLAVECGRAHTRAHLAGLLWSDQPDEMALHNLRQTLSYLRKTLGETPGAAVFLQVEHNTIRLHPQAQVRVDVHDFESRLAAAYRHFGRLNAQALRAALELHRGPFLDQVTLEGSPIFDEWAMLKREQLLQRCAEGLARLAEFHERRSEYHLAREVLQRLLRLTPWEESAHAELMRLLAMDGQTGAAQTQYKLLRRYLREHLGVEPSAQSQALFETIRAGGLPTPRFPAASANLPQGGLPFVGRGGELAELANEIIDPQCRLLTLLGPGGAGKTRLALEVARQEVGAFPDGVFFAALREARDPAQLLAALADALELHVSDHSTPEAQLGDFLRRKNLLFVLDNFEQLLADQRCPALLARLLKDAQTVTFLVTSRQRLNLREECVFELEGLSLTGTSGAEGDALTLFERRARQVKRAFALDEENRPAAEKICWLLGGLPLGIELAAATLWWRTCAEIAEAVQRDLDVLVSSATDAAPEHASLRAVFEVSWGLLNGNERNAFVRLTVFRGGFDAAAAWTVTGVAAQTLDALVSHSLLRREAIGRFDFHETLRQYAAEKLAANYEAACADCEAHADYYTQMLTGLREEICNAGQAQALDRVQCELDNARLAWERLTARRDGASLAACAEVLYQFFSIRSRFVEGAGWFGPAAGALEGKEGARTWLASMLSRKGALLQRARQNDDALAALERSRELLTGLDESLEMGFCLIGLGGVYLRRKDFELALDVARQAQDLFRRTDSLDGLSNALYLQGLILDRMGNFEAAEPLVERAVSAARQSGNPRRKIAPLNLLGDIACIQGDYTAAEHIFSEALEACRQLDDRFNLGIVVNNLATVYHLTARYDLAEGAYRESLAICRDQGDRDGEALALNNLGELAVARGMHAEAEALSRQALTIAEELGEEWTIIVCLYNLGEAANAAGDSARALGFYRRGAVLALEVNANDQAARIVVNAARALQRSGKPGMAADLLRAALSHPATEEAEREKARAWLTELGGTQPEVGDETLLEAALLRWLGES
jgi:predicted ATPase/DNA-binding SARP family transcriptional activator/Tfp pilus assembly protein PilF